MMHKLYVGNLSREVSERTLRTLFEDQGLGVTDILVKNKPQSCYAFVDCPDQTTVDKAIDSLNGYNLLGSVLQVEPSMSIHRRTAKIIIRHVPSQVTHEDLLRLVSAFGPVIKTDESTNRNGENVVVVIYESPEAAQEAASQLNGYELLGTQISVELAAPRNNRRFGGRRNFSGMGSNRNSDFPLRILVPREMVGAVIGRGGETVRQITQQSRARILVPRETVGAIIGRGGQTIKKITQDTRARVDVHRKETVPGSVEKAITIYGAPENCTKACKEIMAVVQEEANKQNKGEIPLKILCHNNLCGRLIGKLGQVIKGIMEQTGTKASVSSIHEIDPMNMDRVVTVRGSLDAMPEAEAKISAKLRACYEQDMQNMGMNPMALMQPYGPYGMRSALYPQVCMQGEAVQYQGPGGMYGHGGSGGAGGYRGGMQSTQAETTYLYIPSTAVGAIIGTGGQHINYVKNVSGAGIKVADKDEDPNAPERRVTITGNYDAQYKAQLLLFQKIKAEGFFGNDDPTLKVEIMVPRSIVGRIIGKGGKNVRELTRISRAIIKIAEEQTTQGDEVAVQLVAPFENSQLAQRNIRSVVQSQMMPGMGEGPRGGGPGRGMGRGRGGPQNGQ